MARIPEKACIHFDVCGISGDGCIKKCDRFKHKANFAEVKHGEWLYRSFSPPLNVGYQQMVTCSVCAAKFAQLYGVHFKYCPECGAKMDT